MSSSLLLFPYLNPHLVIIGVGVCSTLACTPAATDEESRDRQTESQQQADNDGSEEPDVLQQEILPVVLDQLEALLRAPGGGGDDHARVDAGRQHVVSEDEIKEGVGEPVHLLHAHTRAT